MGSGINIVRFPFSDEAGVAAISPFPVFVTVVNVGGGRVGSCVAASIFTDSGGGSGPSATGFFSSAGMITSSLLDG